MPISSSQVTKIFKRVYDAYQWHVKRYPKAAKKARVRKKWRKRFGPGITGYIFESDSFMSSLIETSKRYTEEISLGYN